MTAIGTLPVLLATGDHASRPAASAVGKGGLYSCTTHGLIYQTDGTTWTTWASFSAGAVSDTAYGSGWNGDTSVAPSKNAVYDKIETLSAGVVPWHIAPDGGAINMTARSVGAANRAIYVPCTIPAACTLTGIRIVVGTSSGNICVALYSSAGSRVATSGAVACPATGNQTVAFTGNYAAAAGRYYLALSCDNNTATFGFNQNAAGGAGPTAALFEATAHPLPATATMTAGISAPAVVGLISGGWP